MVAPDLRRARTLARAVASLFGSVTLRRDGTMHLTMTDVGTPDDALSQKRQGDNNLHTILVVSESLLATYHVPYAVRLDRITYTPQDDRADPAPPLTIHTWTAVLTLMPVTRSAAAPVPGPTGPRVLADVPVLLGSDEIVSFMQRQNSLPSTDKPRCSL